MEKRNKPTSSVSPKKTKTNKIGQNKKEKMTEANLNPKRNVSE